LGTAALWLLAGVAGFWGVTVAGAAAAGFLVTAVAGAAAAGFLVTAAAVAAAAGFLGAAGRLGVVAGLGWVLALAALLWGAGIGEGCGLELAGADAALLSEPFTARAAGFLGGRSAAGMAVAARVAGGGGSAQMPACSMLASCESI